jgi:hypothetical protein
MSPLRLSGIIPGVSEVMCPKCKRYNKPVDVTIESISDIEAHLSSIYAMLTRLHDLVNLNVEINQRIIDGYQAVRKSRNPESGDNSKIREDDIRRIFEAGQASVRGEGKPREPHEF